jgi:hypothetical protein
MPRGLRRGPLGHFHGSPIGSNGLLIESSSWIILGDQFPRGLLVFVPAKIFLQKVRAVRGFTVISNHAHQERN